MITETKTHRVDPDITVFEISGRLNLGNLMLSVENAIRALIDSGSRKLVIDVAGLNSIDSSGIGLLISCNGHMVQAGGGMRISGAGGAVAKVFDMISMHKIVPLDPDRAASLSALSSGPAALSL